MPDKEAIYLHVARLIKSAVHNHLDHISEITGAALQILTRGQINDLLQFAPQVLCSPQIQDHWLTITIIWDDHTGALARTCPRALSVIAATAMYTILGKEMALLVLPTGTALAATEQATVFISAAKGLLLPIQQELAYARLQMEGEDHKEALLYVAQAKNDDFEALTKHITETSPAALATAALQETEIAWTNMHYQADTCKPFPPDEQFTTEHPAPCSMQSFSDLGVTVGSPIENWTATTPLDFLVLSQAYLFIAHPAHYLTHGADKMVGHFCQGNGNIRTTGIPSRIGNPASTGAGMSTLFGIQDLTEGHASAHTAILHISGLNSGIEMMEKKLLCYAGGLAAVLPTDGVTSSSVSRFFTSQKNRTKHKYMDPFTAAFTAPYVPTQINSLTPETALTGRELKPDAAIEYSLTSHTKIKLHIGTAETCHKVTIFCDGIGNPSTPPPHEGTLIHVHGFGEFAHSMAPKDYNSTPNYGRTQAQREFRDAITSTDIFRANARGRVRQGYGLRDYRSYGIINGVPCVPPLPAHLRTTHGALGTLVRSILLALRENVSQAMDIDIIGYSAGTADAITIALTVYREFTDQIHNIKLVAPCGHPALYNALTTAKLQNITTIIWCNLDTACPLKDLRNTCKELESIAGKKLVTLYATECQRGAAKLILGASCHALLTVLTPATWEYINNSPLKHVLLPLHAATTAAPYPIGNTNLKFAYIGLQLIDLRNTSSTPIHAGLMFTERPITLNGPKPTDLASVLGFSVLKAIKNNPNRFISLWDGSTTASNEFWSEVAEDPTVLASEAIDNLLALISLLANDTNPQTIYFTLWQVFQWYPSTVIIPKHQSSMRTLAPLTTLTEPIAGHTATEAFRRTAGVALVAPMPAVIVPWSHPGKHSMAVLSDIIFETGCELFFERDSLVTSKNHPGAMLHNTTSPSRTQLTAGEEILLIVTPTDETDNTLAAMELSREHIGDTLTPAGYEEVKRLAKGATTLGGQPSLLHVSSTPNAPLLANIITPKQNAEIRSRLGAATPDTKHIPANDWILCDLTGITSHTTDPTAPTNATKGKPIVIQAIVQKNDTGSEYGYRTGRTYTRCITIVTDKLPFAGTCNVNTIFKTGASRRQDDMDEWSTPPTPWRLMAMLGMMPTSHPHADIALSPPDLLTTPVHRNNATCNATTGHPTARCHRISLRPKKPSAQNGLQIPD